MNIHQYIHEQVPDVLSNIHQKSQACIFCINTFLKKQKYSRRHRIFDATALNSKITSSSFECIFDFQCNSFVLMFFCLKI